MGHVRIGDFTPLWALTWFPGRMRRTARYEDAFILLLIALLEPWVGGLLAIYYVLQERRAPTPSYGVLQLLYEPTRKELWLHCGDDRCVLQTRWFGQRRIRFAHPPFVLYADEFTPADYARLRRCIRGIVAVRE